MATVNTIREVAKGQPNWADDLRLACPECRQEFSPRLSDYHMPEDAQEFWCPDCDVPLWLRSEKRRLAQRVRRNG